MIRVFLIFLLLLTAGCASTDQVRRPGLVSDKEIVWPPPPQAPKIRFLYGFHEPGDFGFTPSFFEQIAEFFAGDEPRGMVRPYAIAADDNLIAVADPGLRALHIYDLKAQEYRRIETVLKEDLVSPVGVGLNSNSIYLADSALGKVFVLDRDGNHRRTITGLERPTGIAYHPGSDRLFVADTLKHRIAVFDAEGAQVLTFGTRGGKKANFNFPSHISLHRDTLYVNDTMNFRIQAFSLDGRFLSSFGQIGDGSGQFAQPKGVGSDSEGHIYVVDALFNRVQIFDKAGRFLLAFGGQGQKPGEFWLPSGIFIAGNKIFVADSYNQRVQVFSFLGAKS